MPPDNVEAFVRLKASTRVPICQSERAFTRFRFRGLIEKPAADIIMPDLSWGGGFTDVMPPIEPGLARIPTSSRFRDNGHS